MRDKTRGIKKFFASLLLLVTCSSNSLFATITSSTTSTTTKTELENGDVELVKTASWENIEEGIARIDLTVKSKPITRPVDVVLVVDKSGSMGFGWGSGYSPCMNEEHNHSGIFDFPSKDNGCIDRLDVAKSAVNTFLTNLYSNPENKDSRVALVTFSSSASSNCNFTNSAKDINNAMLNVNANGGTNYTNALNTAKSYIDGRDEKDKSRPTYIIFLTDGNPDSSSVDGSSVARTLKANGTVIYGVAIGSNVTSNALQNLSSGAGYYQTATTANDLTSIYSSIANRMKNAGTKLEIEDVIGSDFDFYAGIEPTQGYELSNDNRIITWNETEITEGERTYTFYIKVKDDEEHKNGSWKTNNGAKIKYTDINNENMEKVVEDPILGRNKYAVEYYLQNADETYSEVPNEAYSFITTTGVEVSAEQKVFEKYYLDTEKSNVTGTVTDDGKLVLRLYYARVKGTVTVKYVDENGQEIPNTTDVKTGVLDSEYKTDAKVIPGYRLVEEPSNKNGIFVDGNIDVIYKYERADGTVTVKYIDQETREELDSEILTKKVGDEYTTTAKEFADYNLVETPVNANGTVIEGNIIVTYEYVKKTGSVVAKYVDEAGNKVADPITINGKVGENYSTETKTIYGYEIKEIPSNPTGKITEGETILTYVYARKDGKVIVKYVDKEGKEIADQETIVKKVFDNYETSRKTIYGYKSIGIDPSNKVGTVKEETITVIYVYERQTSEVIVKYVDRTNKEIEKSDKISGNVGDKYTTTAKEIYGYKLEVTPENANGEFVETTTTVTYIYSKIPGSVVVKYMDIEGKEIVKAERIDGHVNDDYTTVKKDIYGYEFVKVLGNESGKIKEEETVVTYIYAKKDGMVIVNYVDESENKIAESTTINGKVKDNYTTKVETIYGYYLTEVPENATGTIEEEVTVVNYVYAKKDGSVVINYVDEEGNKLTESATINGKVKDNYTTKVETIYGYYLTEVPENATGTIEEEVTVVNYVYAKKDGSVVVNYVDEEGNKLAESATINGKVKDNYTTEEETIYGYYLTEVPSNATGTIEEEVTVVNYVYAKKDGSVVVNYVDEEGNELSKSLSIEGKVGDEYTTESKDIYGYRLTKMPENQNGNIEEEETEVIYVYERITGTVRVEYIDNYGNTIIDPDIISGFVGDHYEVSRKEIDGYVIYAKDPDCQKGEFIDGEIVVTYIYEKPEMINTGDMNIFAYILTLMLSLVGIFYSIRLIRKEENN